MVGWARHHDKKYVARPIDEISHTNPYCLFWVWRSSSQVSPPLGPSFWAKHHCWCWCPREAKPLRIVVWRKAQTESLQSCGPKPVLSPSHMGTSRRGCTFVRKAHSNAGKGSGYPGHQKDRTSAPVVRSGITMLLQHTQCCPLLPLTVSDCRAWDPRYSSTF